MTHVLLWLLLYPVVATLDTVGRVRIGRINMNIGTHNIGHLVVYVLGTVLLVTLHYV